MQQDETNAKIEKRLKKVVYKRIVERNILRLYLLHNP